MFDIFCCVGFDSLFFVKTGEKHPRFYIKIFCFLNIKKARKHGLFKVSIHLVSPIWLRETATYFSHDTFQIFILFSKIEKISRNDKYMTRNLHTLKFCSENMHKNQPYICAILQNSMLSTFLLSNYLTFTR